VQLWFCDLIHSCVTERVVCLPECWWPGSECWWPGLSETAGSIRSWAEMKTGLGLILEKWTRPKREQHHQDGCRTPTRDQATGRRTPPPSGSKSSRRRVSGLDLEKVEEKERRRARSSSPPPSLRSSSQLRSQVATRLEWSRRGRPRWRLGATRASLKVSYFTRIYMSDAFYKSACAAHA
jgi:hypothetical protein